MKDHTMEFRIADTFTDSLARLTGDEQKAVKTTAFDLQLNPVNPGMNARPDSMVFRPVVSLLLFVLIFTWQVGVE